MTPPEIMQALRNEDQIQAHQFAILKSLAPLLAKEETFFTGQGLLLKALEFRNHFQETSDLLEALIQQCGLYPYMVSEQMSLRDSVILEFNRPLNMPAPFIFHREQREIYHRLLAGDSIILSAPTSFGKSRIIDAMIASKNYNNIVVVVPTLALIDETRRRFSLFSDNYKIITHQSQTPINRNLFVLTPERVISFEELPPIDFFVIDEFYKIDALSEDTTRTVALNIAFLRLFKSGAQFFMLGPSIDQIPTEIENQYRCYFYPTKYRTVVAEYHQVRSEGDEIDRLIELCRSFDDPTLIFCRSPNRVNEVAFKLLEAGIGKEKKEIKTAAEWTSAEYHPEWIWPRAARYGIGIHHGRLPRSIAQYTVRMFNELKLQFLICTSTLIEGVNTKAKNVIVFDNEIARTKIDFFTFNNIAGRSGRMFEHFVGHVYHFHAPPEPILPFVDFPLFSQGENVPDSLIVQIDQEDLQPGTKPRVEPWKEQQILPMAILRANATIDPDSQISLAKAIALDSNRFSQLLSWNQQPNWEQLLVACELIWEYLHKSPRGHSGVFSGRQLAFKISQLERLLPLNERIKLELQPGQFAATTPNEAVERILQFDRNWASFEFPRLIMALSRIQKYVSY